MFYYTISKGFLFLCYQFSISEVEWWARGCCYYFAFFVGIHTSQIVIEPWVSTEVPSGFFLWRIFTENQPDEILMELLRGLCPKYSQKFKFPQEFILGSIENNLLEFIQEFHRGFFNMFKREQFHDLFFLKFFQKFVLRFIPPRFLQMFVRGFIKNCF